MMHHIGGPIMEAVLAAFRFCTDALNQKGVELAKGNEARGVVKTRCDIFSENTTLTRLFVGFCLPPSREEGPSLPSFRTRSLLITVTGWFALRDF
jgi:hypothetical protein